MPTQSKHATPREVARSLGAPAALTPFLDDLFVNLCALGSAPRRIASLVARFSESVRAWPDAPRRSLSLRHSEPKSGLRVLDLACGKGAVAVELARRGHHVTGVDACPGFIDRARELAARHHVEHLCAWHIADVRRWSPKSRVRFDVAMMIGLDSLADAAPRLRRFVKPGGLYLIDDAIRDPRHPKSRLFGEVPDAFECAAMIESLGDRVARRVKLPKAVVKSQHHAISMKLASAARSLARRYPKLRRPLAQFLANQRAASTVLLGPLRPTLWLIQRG